MMLSMESAVQKVELVDLTAHADMFAGISPSVSRLYSSCHDLHEIFPRPRVAIVGSRKVSAYGKAVTATFARELAEQGIVIVSGLAIGVDGIAHRAALESGGLTVAVLPSSLEHIYPTSHVTLANQIVEQGGALLSEYGPGSTIAYKNQFIERNRIVSGISDVLLITEAAVNSGTMHTARFALEQGKDVLAIPGNINSPLSEGTNNLIKVGARLVTSVDEVLQTLGLSRTDAKTAIRGDTPQEQIILDLITAGLSDGAELQTRSSLEITAFNQALTMLEITGKIRSLGNNQWSL